MKRDYAILIPTKSRPDSLVKMFRKCPFLNSADVFIGIEKKEQELYRSWRNKYGSKCTIIWVNNPEGYVGNAREPLRQAATNVGYKRYLLTDDNAVFTPRSIEDLLIAQDLEDCIMSGMGQPPMWHKDNIAAGNVYTLKDRTITTFVSYSTVHWVIPHYLYSEFAYPKDCHNDDVYFALWAILRKNFTTFRTCLEAKYSKKRFQPGGNGPKNKRLIKMANGMKMLAEDFPEVATSDWMRTSFGWKKILEYAENKKGKI